MFSVTAQNCATGKSFNSDIGGREKLRAHPYISFSLSRLLYIRPRDWAQSGKSFYVAENRVASKTKTGSYPHFAVCILTQGCNHDRGTASLPDTTTCTSGYNYGYRDPQADFRTVMAYGCGGGQW
jgi:hypothetical protein